MRRRAPPDGYMDVMDLHLTPSALAPAEGRRGIDALSGRIDRKSLGDLKTVISELIALSVTHGAGESIDVSVTIVDEEVEGIVFDGGPATEAILSARELGDSSLTLRIIDSLVEDWGTNPGRTRTWFRMSVATAKRPAVPKRVRRPRGPSPRRSSVRA
jgi:anti-sigma regulatory factor (Ser/Thr protein kinase)